MLHQDDLMRDVIDLTPRERVAFAAACCERLLPNYRAFVVANPTGTFTLWHYRLLRGALDAIWEFVSGAELTDVDASRMFEQIDEVVPDEDYITSIHSIWSHPAVYAAGAIASTLSAIRNQSSEAIVEVSQSAFASLDSYLHSVNEPIAGMYNMGADWISFMELMASAPLVIAEAERQRQDLQILKQHPFLQTAVVEQIRASSREVGIQPFKRGLLADPGGDLS